MAQRGTGRGAAKPAAKPAAKSGGKVAIRQLPWYELPSERIVLVSGPEGFLADRASQRLREFLRSEDPSLEVHDLAADSYARGELLTLASPSLFGEPRLIRVDAVEKCSDDFLEDALAYLESPDPDTTLVLRHGGGVRGKKLLDTIRAGTGGGVEIVCGELKKDSEKQEFAAAEFKTAGRYIAPSALRALVTAFSDDLAELSAACRQLVADTTGDITDAEVTKYYGGRAEVSAFEVADLAIAGRQGPALIALRHALDSGSDPVPMVAAFAMKIRTMAKVADSHGPAARLAGPLGLAPWQIDRARRDLNGWTDEGLGRVVQALAETDAAVKGASRDPVFSLEQLVGLIAARGRR
ncbi:DNA polymerase III subunit delta [Agromyces seonyuensis]|uniref:DNA-directed DNA polymerase n=1 Tax=Agromyces seonyuensis TaxID=2662446 RepID=A0A6I4P0E3_9MICO|nr:DNA polymerase III subunit delta [Agromyces seonyuensis]MWC00104.1 DNA polymerase III subunit delta [Agromyces seonyuensis]